MGTFFAIYMGKARSPVGKSNGWCHSVWEVSDWAVRSETRQFSPPFSLFRLILIYFVKTLSPTLSKFIVSCL